MRTPLRSMVSAPTTGPVLEILVSVVARNSGQPRWLVAHYAVGGGEEQPRFKGWFHWTGHDYTQIDEASIRGWLPIEGVVGAPTEREIRADERNKAADMFDASADEVVGGKRRPQIVNSLRALARLLRRGDQS